MATTTRKTTTKPTTTRKRTTTTRKTTTKTAVKPIAAAATTPEVAPVVSLVEATAADAPATEDKAPEAMMRKKDLVDRVVEASGMKKKDVKPAVEAALVELGKALAAGETLNLHPFGKLKITRRKELPDGEALTARIRRSNRLAGDETALADSDGDS
ncbi:hypothetical protein ACMU_12335 [Actibacterium mucosum KCTC 23349]|uniref:DNA-binding protein n=1 Tax=Actibacterium mucosum KCTC 23349 TaxID=1454373 RepID=A0A037ZIM8_9RHOB|nr:HU family DNA-binding protein [Actibacterium mucosum]KAJ55474.1 hypothetical protein ACMU_12335 [Actibacterium mucosum KCTC 23349]